MALLGVYDVKTRYWSLLSAVSDGLCHYFFTVLWTYCALEKSGKGWTYFRCHLLFADDSIIFSKATSREGQAIVDVLHSYAKADEVREELKTCFGLADANISHDMYLGLPSFVGRNQRVTFNMVKESVMRKLRIWKGKLFSMAGREIHIKAVVQAIATYTLTNCSSFKILLSKVGGLSRILIHLLPEYSRAKYFHHGPILEVEVGHNPSYTWRSLLWGKELLAKGIRWQVGSGRNVTVFRDPWMPPVAEPLEDDVRLPRPHSFKPITPCSEGMEELLVEDLIVNRQWDRSFVQANFLPVDQGVIFSIPLAYGMSKDRWMWHFDSKGLYTVKSGYKLAMEFEAQPRRLHGD
ncbi:uncharacterized protein LOC112091106 [Morus notabilis]|uniref:uncharacterized protein LOC112091106 n=1 Tax=Morus notabilis TaxID=981085 RepID=UPI000CED1630|nr:uncharacterized protein LOC112091106 [Morus notabilis]